MLQDQQPRICVICGEHLATTVDHLPPKAIFSKPCPSDLITVPACSRCNNESSMDDEQFRNDLSLHIGMDTDKKRELLNRTARAIKRNKKLQREIEKNRVLVELFSEGGVFLGRQMGVRWNSQAHDRVVERIVRGLYFHHHRCVLGKQVEVKVGWCDHRLSLPPGFKKYCIGDGDFTYWYALLEGYPLHSLWFFLFYNKHWASGKTLPLNRS
jgi:hypothetical protein